VKRRAVAAAIAVAVLGGSLLLAGDPQRVITVQRIDVTRLPDITVYLTVTDAKGGSVLGLTALEVSVALDGTAQPLASLTSAIAGGESLAVALLFDRSGSMKSALDQAKDAAVQFIRRLSVADQMAIVSFDDKVRIDSGFSTDRAALEGAVRSIAAGQDTALVDALRAALGLFKGVTTRRQAILVLSDGKDTRSQARADEVLAEAKAQGVAVFALGLGPAVDEAALDRFASPTGGAVLKAAQPGELLRLYQRIADQLTNQYRLTFASTFGGDEKWHTLRVGVQGGDGAPAAAEREFISSLGPGVSRDVLSGAERREEGAGVLRDAALGAAGGFVLGLLLLVALRVVRRDAEFRPSLAAAIVIIFALLGGIIGIVVKELGR
jgi:VWFA-related protein